MSCGSIDGFQNILGDAFKALSNSLKCIDNTSAAIAQQSADATSQLTAATSAIDPMVLQSAGFEPTAISSQIAGIGESINGFAAGAVEQSGSLVGSLQQGILGQHALTSIESQSSGEPPPDDPYAEMTEKTMSICETLGNGLKTVRDTVNGVLSKIGGFLSDILSGSIDAIRKLFDAISDAASAVTSAIGSAISSVVNTVKEIASAAASAIKEAFCKGMEAVFPTMAPKAPADLAGTEYI
jgi:phage-related protein